MSDSRFNRGAGTWKMDVAGAFFFLALTTLAYLIEFEPALRDRDALRTGSAELAEKRDTISHLQSTVHIVNGQIASLAAKQADELKLQPQSQINDRLSAISALATDRGLTVDAIEPGESTNAARYSTIPIRINGRGKFPDAAIFIHAVHSELPDTSVTDINIASGGGDTAPAVALNLLWYAAPAPIVAKTDPQ